MAQFVGTNINIEGRIINQFSSLTLSQAISEHHTFRLICPAETIDGTLGPILNTSKWLLGAVITIQIIAIKSLGSLCFKGVITEVEASRNSGHAGDIIISGYSPTIMMDGGPWCRTWENADIKNIASDVLLYYPQNLLQSKINPTHSEKLPYTVQYNESDWQFLNRLSATNGEWFFYDGEKLILDLPRGNKVNLVYGNNLSHFSMTLNAKPAKFWMKGHDYSKHDIYISKSSAENTATNARLNDLGKHTLQRSEQLFFREPRQWNNCFLNDQKQLDDFVNTRAATQSSTMVYFNGSSDHAGVQVGGTVNVQGKNVFDKSEECFGDYTVVSLHHYCDGQGNYTNNFIAIPSSIYVPPVTNFPEPKCETQSAVVTDNYDDKGLGRVRVQFFWMLGRAKSPWLRITTPHAGSSKGIFFMPEVGEEVIIGFEGDNPTQPYVIGTVYNGKAKCEFSNDTNDIKVLKTRSGNKIEMNDKNGSVHILDSKGNDIFLTGDGNIEIKSSKKIIIKSSGIDISAGSINLNASNININASEELKLEGKVEGIKLKGEKIEQKAETTMEISGLDTKVIGSTQLDLDGGMLAKLHAALVKIN